MVLVQCNVMLQVTAANGRQFDLPLSGGKSGTAALYFNAPVTIRHIINENSPLHPDNAAAVTCNGRLRSI